MVKLPCLRTTAAPIALLLAATSARAAGFDAATGKVTTAGAAYALSFDDAAAIQGQGLSGADFVNELTFDELGLAGRIERDAAGIECGGALAAGGDLVYVAMDLGGLDFVGRRIQAFLWQKPQGTRMMPSISWYLGDPLDLTIGGTVTFQPTGNVTDDGWEEWTSGPVDWAWADVVAPASLDLFDEGQTAYYGGASPDESARSLIDALYIEDLGAAAVPASRCALPTEAADCGAAGLCHLGRCVDAAIRVGQPLFSDALRADYIDRRLFEIDHFEGGRAPRTKLELVREALVPLKETPSAATFWPTFSEAYTLLVDGHASAPLMSYPAFHNAGVCVHEGEADLLAGAPVVPLVFQAFDNIVGAALQPGDALIAIDGLPTADWAAAAHRLITHPGDPAGRSVVTAPQVFAAAVDSGAVVTFARCAAPPAACDDPDHIVIDLGVIIGDPLLEGITAVGYDDRAPCDYRFVRPVSSNDQVANTSYEFAGHSDDAGVRFLVINGVPSYYSVGGQEWFEAVDDALDDQPPLLVLDERTGAGGGIDAVDFIGSYLIGPDDLFGMDFLPSFENDAPTDDRDEVVACSTSGPPSGFGCGNGFRWFVGDAADGTHGNAAGSKVAVLMAMDVSGNDYLTRMLDARAGETRVFGAGAAFGAYGVIWSMAAHIGELAGGSLQVQDTIFMVDDNDDNASFATSTGERPETIVRQRQSDALGGRDTGSEAARSFLQ